MSFNLTNPSAIIFVNNDLSDQVQSTLVSQLQINDTITGAEFDSRVTADPNYPNNIHINNLRVLVIRDFSDLTNRNLADIVIFIKSGLAAVEYNKYGPHNITMPVAGLYLNKLIFNQGPSNVCGEISLTDPNVIIPSYCQPFPWIITNMGALPGQFPYGTYTYCKNCNPPDTLAPSACKCFKTS